MSPLRIAFFGTPEIAVPTLERLISSRHELVGVVSQPDRGRGRGRKPQPSPVAAVALRETIPLLRPEKVGDADSVEMLRGWRPDLGVVVAFGQFLPKAVRELPAKGYLINAHASLLPRHRGAAPIARAILAGDAETGISVMRIEKEMDAGPVAAVARTPIAARENTLELSLRLSALAAELIVQVVDSIEADRVVWTPQDAAHATHAAKLEKSDAILDLDGGRRRPRPPDPRPRPAARRQPAARQRRRAHRAEAPALRHAALRTRRTRRTRNPRDEHAGSSASDRDGRRLARPPRSPARRGQGAPDRRIPARLRARARRAL